MAIVILANLDFTLVMDSVFIQLVSVQKELMQKDIHPEHVKNAIQIAYPAQEKETRNVYHVILDFINMVKHVIHFAKHH